MGENIVMDNLEIFKLNGFQFEIDHKGTCIILLRASMGDLEPFYANILAMPTKQVKLIGQPVSKNWTLGPKGASNNIIIL